MKNRFTSQRGLKFLFCNRRLPFLGALALICLLALSSQPVIAQTVTGSMVGNITDSSGGSVPGATVKITLTTTNNVRTVQADTAGAYTIAAVVPGTYKVEVTEQGFRTFVVDNILVNQNNVVRVDAQLQVGALAERVEVTTQAAAALETERAEHPHRDRYHRFYRTATANPRLRGAVCDDSRQFGGWGQQRRHQ